MIHVIPYILLGYLSGSLLFARFFGRYKNREPPFFHLAGQVF